MKYKLGHKKAVKTHNDIITHVNSYSLTLTLKPYANSMPIHEQFRKMMKDITEAFTEINRTYNIVMFTPELTKDYNIHVHAYLVLPLEEDHIRFEQAFKTVRRKALVIGPNYKLKKIDEITDALKKYPFKDIERTESVRQRIEGKNYESRANVLFEPYHLILKGMNSFINNIV